MPLFASNGANEALNASKFGASCMLRGVAHATAAVVFRKAANQDVGNKLEMSRTALLS
jgi:hypothetical protein